MNVLWVFAHPEPRSLNGALRDHGAATLRRLGHRVRHSDLYAMGWNPVVGPADFGHDPRDRLLVGAASERAHAAGTLAPDIRAEQGKIAWADALVVQFPLWWFGMPAILKGWFDRVFVQGFAFGVTDDRGRTLRYGDGGLSGRRALVVTTAGARPTGLGPRGVHGDAEDVLFPLLHGTLFYTGMDVLPPLVVASADRARPADHAAARAALDDRLRALPTATPIPYRAELGGDYDADLVLRPHLAPARTGLTVHRTDPPAGPAPRRDRTSAA
ncbi:NAD(P)H-dependent oxidoreductase [Actinomadura chibensis]|uniref:NAD(P)H-dependent oxidoreductase n=1 Tax=Actinomadura chibensis TaxID=392828 RepID=A0A5D0NKR7_9ACTN|nr:NAD(P)H-dependent oxidoreductase [Actinomadura chibensis]TYB44965.1 NAD(P)H-dependent oxidoreductase [Actinomadura chibensis]